MGGSAGGGLAAGLALLARDRAEIPVAFQVLSYPVLDDRMATRSSRGPACIPSDRRHPAGGSGLRSVIIVFMSVTSAVGRFRCTR
jgi:acetyl esterase/lipase